MTLRRTQDPHKVLSVQLRDAIRTAIDEHFVEGGGISKLAKILGVEDSTVGRWANPKSKISVGLDRVVQIEDALNLRRGHLLRAAGFIAADSDLSVEEVIRQDPRFTPRQKTNLIETVRVYAVHTLIEEPEDNVRSITTATTKAAARKKAKS